MKPEITMERFEELLPKICDRETSSDPENCTPENPFWGHCAVVALVAQNLFGGKLARISLQGTKFHRLRSHYWNLFSDGSAKDFTSSQFQGQKPILTVSERTRSYILYNPETGLPREIMKRYKLLAFRLARTLDPGNPLFDDLFYKLCFDHALDSLCQKMKFGVVVVYTGANQRVMMYEFVYEGCNKIDGHAEEMALWEVVKKCVPLSECEMYVAGIYPNGLPYIKTEPEFSCLRCAVQIYYSGIKKVWVPVVDHWEGLTGEECVKTARAYAMKEKTIQ